MIVGAVVLLGCVVLLGANLYVQSKGTQTRIQQEVSHRVGADVRIQRISVTPWGGLSLSGLTIPNFVPNQSRNFLEARTLRISVDVGSLFSQNLVIKNVSLVQPSFIWPQNDEGKWRLPPSPYGPADLSGGDVSALPDNSLPGRAVPSGIPQPNESIAAPRLEKPRWHWGRTTVQRVNINDGSFRLLDRSGELVASFDKVDFRSAVTGGVALDGKAVVEKASLRDRFFLTELRTPVHYTPEQVVLPKIAAHGAGGDIEGDFSLQPQTEDAPYQVSLHCRNLNADEVVAKAGGPTGMVQGRLDGSFVGHGVAADANVLTGSGELVLRNGQLRQYSLLTALGQILQIEELTQLHLDQAEAKYHVDAGIITVDRIVLRSPNIRLSATGTIDFNGKLQLQAQLAINDKVRGQLFKPIRANFQPLNDEAGLWGVDFEIRGTVARPKSNLLEKVVGRDLKDLGSVINGFLGGSKQDRAKRKKRAAESPEPPPAGSPEPAPSPAP
jgi:type II secretion system protein N